LRLSVTTVSTFRTSQSDLRCSLQATELSFSIPHKPRLSLREGLLFRRSRLRSWTVGFVPSEMIRCLLTPSGTGTSIAPISSVKLSKSRAPGISRNLEPCTCLAQCELHIPSFRKRGRFFWLTGESGQGGNVRWSPILLRSRYLG
jgi:hypothetical protein